MKRRRFETCSFFNFKSVIQILMQMRRFDSGGGVVRKRSLPFERFGFFKRNPFPVCFLESFTSFSLMQLIEKYSMKIMRTQLLEFEPPSFLVKLGHCRALFLDLKSQRYLGRDAKERVCGFESCFYDCLNICLLPYLVVIGRDSC